MTERVWRGEEFWRKAIATQRRSGLSIQRYCFEHDLAVSTFQSWKARLKDEPLFAEVQVESAIDRSSPIEIELVDGTLLRCQPGLNGDDLATVLRALRATAC